ncbi:LysR family transcriptional regulator [Fusibacter paucivorans]|uniref:LysR family transcriptional regulator n=1 Tax=Fusibacter paucivorans TaxID=76009 RepID=A0ABS5PT53_9FIRM|nr:LysR family transcriptional regulator [Fusibacter paucivorans]MBS7527526.1 LysR family transcriptional regulator [Fusibacter paucivorans]
MDMQQIECALSVAKHLNFSEASYELMMNQSTVSKKIANLEKEIGFSLFDRSTHPISLTAMGQIFIEGAETLFEDYLQLLSNLSASSSELDKKLTIGSIGFSKSESIVNKIAEFKMIYPDVNIELIDGTTTPLVEGLLSKHLDIAIVSSMYSCECTDDLHCFKSDSRFLSASISKDPYYLIVHPDHPLASQKLVTYDDIAHVKLIMLDKRMDVYHNALNNLFAAENITPKIAMTSSSARDALTLVARNVGVAILSKKVAADASGVILVPFERPLIRDTQVLIRNERRKPEYATQLYQFLQSSTGDH